MIFYFSLLACVEPISSESLSGEESAIPLKTKTKHILGSTALISLSFQQTSEIRSGVMKKRQQEGQIRTRFHQNGEFDMCGGILETKSLDGDAPAVDGLPAGMVTNQKIAESASTLAWRGYQGSWREEGAWMVGSLDGISPKGNCNGTFTPFSGGRFWCHRLTQSPLNLAIVCGFEKSPIRSDWQTVLSPDALPVKLELPPATKNQHLHWVVLGTPTGMLWACTK